MPISSLSPMRFVRLHFNPRKIDELPLRDGVAAFRDRQMNGCRPSR